MPTVMCLARSSRPLIQRHMAEGPRRPGWRWLIWPLFLILAGYLLFCHGCHGDEDTELLGRAHARAHRGDLWAELR